MSGSTNDQGKFETRAIHAGQAPDPQTGAVMVPVYLTSTYAQSSPAKPIGGYEYSRTHNPTRTALQDCLASLEKGTWGLCYSSGLAATNALADRLVPGDHVVAGDDLYGGTYRLFTKVFERYGIGFTFVDTTDVEAVRAAFTPATRMLYVETPSNPLLRLTDLGAMADAIVRETGARGIRSVMEEAMLQIMYDIPSRSDVRKVIISEDTILKILGENWLRILDAAKQE